MTINGLQCLQFDALMPNTTKFSQSVIELASAITPQRLQIFPQCYSENFSDLLSLGRPTIRPFLQFLSEQGSLSVHED
jgi:hypothetical protein